MARLCMLTVLLSLTVYKGNCYKKLIHFRSKAINLDSAGYVQQNDSETSMTQNDDNSMTLMTQNASNIFECDDKPPGILCEGSIDCKLLPIQHKEFEGIQRLKKKPGIGGRKRNVPDKTSIFEGRWKLTGDGMLEWTKNSLSRLTVEEAVKQFWRCPQKMPHWKYRGPGSSRSAKLSRRSEFCYGNETRCWELQWKGGECKTCNGRIRVAVNKYSKHWKIKKRGCVVNMPRKAEEKKMFVSKKCTRARLQKFLRKFFGLPPRVQPGDKHESSWIFNGISNSDKVCSDEYTGSLGCSDISCKWVQESCKQICRGKSCKELGMWPPEDGVHHSHEVLWGKSPERDLCRSSECTKQKYR